MAIVINILAVIGVFSLIVFVFLIVKIILPIFWVSRVYKKQYEGGGFDKLAESIESSSISSVSEAFEAVNPVSVGEAGGVEEMTFWDADLDERGFQKGVCFLEPSLSYTGYQVFFHPKGYVALVGFDDDSDISFIEFFAESSDSEYVTVSSKSKGSAIGFLPGEQRVYRANAEFCDLLDVFKGYVKDKVIKPFSEKDFFERYDSYRVKQAFSLIQDTDFLDEFDEIYARDKNDFKLSSYSDFISKACEYEFSRACGWPVEKWMLYQSQLIFVHDRSLEGSCGIESEDLTLSEASKLGLEVKCINRKKYKQLTGNEPIATMDAPVAVDVYHKSL